MTDGMEIIDTSGDESDVSKDEAETVEEEYQTWKKNCPYMYNWVSESALTWPSLTIQWSQTFNETADGAIQAELLLGTNSSGSDQDYLIVGQTSFHKSLLGPTTPKILPGYIDSKIKPIKSFKHVGEVNRARYLPQDPNIVATMGNSGDGFIYNISEDPETFEATKLQFHTENGYGVSWNPTAKGSLLTASDDKKIALWTITDESTNSKILKPTSIISSHSEIVNDIRWHQTDPNLFASVSDDKELHIHDIRSSNLSTIPSLLTKAHDGAVNSVSFSPFSKNLLATASEDSTIGLFDLRNLSTKLHSLMGHNNSVTGLDWSPHHDGFLASSGLDRRVILWNIFKIGKEQTQDDAEDGAPELFFMHGGHTSEVTDFSWNPNLPWLLGSCADDNIVQLWSVNRTITEEEEDVPDLKDLE